MAIMDGIAPLASQIGIELFNDFFTNDLAPFVSAGTGTETHVAQSAAGDAGGVILLAAASGASNSAAIVTRSPLVPAVNGPISLRARIRPETSTEDKAVFVGFSDIDDVALDIANLVTVAAAGITGAASDYVGVLYDDDLTDADLQDFWLPIWRGGTGGAQPTDDGIGKDPYNKASYVVARWVDVVVTIGRTGHVNVRVNGRDLADVADAIDPARPFFAHVLVQNREASVTGGIDVDYLQLRAVRGAITTI